MGHRYIKPVVPWDIPGYTYNNLENLIANSALRVPDWVVSNEDVIANVTFTKGAHEQLHNCIQWGKLAPLYIEENDGIQGATDTILQILAQDPRSSHKGLKCNGRGMKVSSTHSTSTMNGNNSLDIIPTNVSSVYSLIVCNVQVSFCVTEDYGCQVIEINPIEFEQSQYVDGIPLITEGLLEQNNLSLLVPE
jgi:hypothetical protein